MTTQNPFPGMNPFFEQTWRSAHALLIAYSIPLREKDPDVILNLQPLISQCHERGRYHLLDYKVDPEPPFSPEDAECIGRILRETGLRR